MAKEKATPGAAAAQNPFLYQQPELLTIEEHGTLGIELLQAPYAFTADVRAIPVTLAEFAATQKDYPIVFTNLDNPYPVAVVGVIEDHNLFMRDGMWEQGCYVPAYLRCYPFAFAGEKDGRIAVAVDRAAACVSENARYPFFDDGTLTQRTQELMRFCAQYEAERRRTAEFCSALKDLGLLSSQQATYTRSGSDKEELLAAYVSIDGEKLAQLDDAAVLSMHRSGRLAASYLQLYSLENWQALIERRAARAG